MAEIITLSSSDEEDPVVPRKRPKLITISSKVEKGAPEEIVILDEDDVDEDCKAVPGVIEDSADDAIKFTPSKSEFTKVSSKNNNNNGDVLKIDSAILEDALKENDKAKDNVLQFLDTCVENLAHSKHKDLVESKLATMKKIYGQLQDCQYDLSELNKIIRNSVEKIKNGPADTILCYTDVLRWLKASFKESMTSHKVSPHKKDNLYKLQRALWQISKRIRKLDKVEVGPDDDENSAYIQADRYRARATQIYKKICEYRQENPYRDCLLYCRLDFSASEYSEINHAINRKYKNDVFPNYYDFSKYIRKCVKQSSLKISENSLEFEMRRCFEELGKLLKRRRKLDLFEIHRDHIDGAVEPDLTGSESIRQLENNRSVAKKNMDDVIAKYSRLQEKGVNPEVSPDSEDSNDKESDSEAEQDENTTKND